MKIFEVRITRGDAWGDSYCGDSCLIPGMDEAVVLDDRDRGRLMRVVECNAREGVSRGGKSVYSSMTDCMVS